jgi:hypothetical protein
MDGGAAVDLTAEEEIDLARWGEQWSLRSSVIFLA